jgi:hypothetical protein
LLTVTDNCCTQVKSGVQSANVEKYFALRAHEIVLEWILSAINSVSSFKIFSQDNDVLIHLSRYDLALQDRILPATEWDMNVLHFFVYSLSDFPLKRHIVFCKIQTDVR